MSDTNLSFFNPSKIEVAPENPRNAETVDQDTITELADSIEANGLLTPMIGYTYKEAVFITAGGRRTRALHKLLDEGRIDGSEVFPVFVFSKEDAIHYGATEQITHKALSPIDELRIYAHPHYKDASDERLAKMLGKSVLAVRQRRAVLQLPEEVLEHVYKGSISVDQAYGLTYFLDDEENMAEMVEACLNSKRLTLGDLREYYTRTRMEWDRDARTAFVTQEKYVAAGGNLGGDLFTDSRFILSPDLLDELAEKKAQAQVEAEHPNAANVFRMRPDRKISFHPGVTQITDEQAERLLDLHEKRWRESMSRDNPDHEEFWDEYDQLRELNEPIFPEDLDNLLEVAWDFSYGPKTPLRIYEHVLPDDLEPLYEAGYLDRPAPESQDKEAEVEDPTPPLDDVVSHALSLRIAALKTEVRRMVAIKNPNDVLAQYLVYACAPIDPYRPTFYHTPDKMAQPAERDMGMVRPSPAWEKAAALDSEDAEVILALKPADQRILLAKKMLDCLTNVQGWPEISAKDIHTHLELDADFFRAYKKQGLIELLSTAPEPVKLKGDEKLSELAERASETYKKHVDWLPIGF